MIAQFVTLSAETIALLLAPHDWSQQLRLIPQLPTAIQKAISNRESRRNYARSFRHNLEYATSTQTAEETTDLKQWLLRLKGHTVAVPLWSDYVEIGAAFSASGSPQALPIAYGSPVRSGAEWVILAEDRSAFEIVNVTALGDGSITIASNTQSWPAGTLMYPLLFGHLPTSGPQLAEETDETVSAVIKVEEDSPFPRRLTVPTGTIPLVGANVAEFATYPLWTHAPVGEPRTLQTREVDILYRQIGFLRQKQKLVYQQPPRRGLEMEFFCENRAEIAAIERLFADRRASVRPFLIPTFTGDLRLAADVAIGAETIQVETTRYADPDYATHPSAPYLALVRSGAIEPIRVQEVDATTLEIVEPVTQLFLQQSTKLCHLLLVRFAESKLQWNYLTDGQASVRIKFIELPDEYVTPNPDLPEPGYLYRFYCNLPTGPYTIGRFTNYENTLSFGGSPFTPAPYSHDSIERTLTLEDRTQLTSWGGNFPGNPLALFLPLTLEADLWLEIIEVNAQAPDDGSAETIFNGIVSKPKMKGDDWTAEVALRKMLAGKFPRMLIQRTDNFIPFSAPTGLDAEDYKDAGTLTELDGFEADVAVGGTLEAANYYAGGWLQRGADDTFEGRHILHSTPISGGHRLVLDRPIVKSEVGDAVDLYPGYNGSYEDHLARYPTGIFGGFPFMPTRGPQIKAVEAKTPTGGKK